LALLKIVFLTIPSNIVCGGSGYGADMNLLINHARQEALRHRLIRHREIPCSRLARRICELMQGYTQYTTLRPFGVRILFAGYDEHEGFQLFTGDPAGMVLPRKAVCFGYGGESGEIVLQKYYSAELTNNEACEVAIKVLRESSDTWRLKPADLQIVIMKKSLTGAIQIDFMTHDEINEFLDQGLSDDEILGDET
jgi:20S proteasome subunit alpha 3